MELLGHAGEEMECLQLRLMRFLWVPTFLWKAVLSLLGGTLSQGPGWDQVEAKALRGCSV